MERYTNSEVRIFLGCAAIVAVLLVASSAREDIMLHVDPSAARAYEYGSRRFDARHPHTYDLERAERFFIMASALEPDYPYLHHQHARIAFLRGDFKTALTEIDREIELYGDAHHNAYYMRGLIRGFAKDYDGAILDYATYLTHDHSNWAAVNDYAWVLLKAGLPEKAAEAVALGLQYHPDNPWLLNTNAIALAETGERSLARAAARRAKEMVAHLAERDWLTAYPGNDPKIASEGLKALRESIDRNMHTLMSDMEDNTLQ